MAYLFDSDVLSAITGSRPNLDLARRVASVPVDDQFSSAITLGEMLFGAVRRGRLALLQRIEELFELVTVLPFDERAARVYADLKADLERQGTPLDEPDLRIASIALSAGLTLVTGNVRHFARLPGLTLENWLV